MSICNLLSLVIPCYNEEATLEETSEQILKLSKNWLEQGLIKSFELIFVDDGSKDNTLSILRNLAGKNKAIKIISLSRNFGHQTALIAGLFHSQGEAIISLDADLQDPPEVIPEMLEKYADGYDIVFGVRKNRKADNFLKKFTAEMFYKAMKFMGANLVFNHADFRLISRTVLKELKKFPETNLFLRGLIPYLGFNQTLVYYERKPRFAGHSKYSADKMFSFAIEGITSFTYFPLRLASVTGFLIAIVSLLLSAWALIIKVLGEAVPGWASTVLPMYFLGGIQLLFLGVIGEYIGKIFIETKRRPLFIIKEKYNFNEF